MALSDRKIPIIVGRNDTPTTSESEENHPNGAYLTNKYNLLIDDLIALPPQNLIITGNGSYDPQTGTLNINNADLAVDHINQTSAVGNTRIMTIWADMGETISLGTFQVSDGQNGTNGVDGINGTDGNGIESASYDPLTGILTFTFTDATIFTTDDLRGNDGVNGVDGVDGQGVDHASFVDNGNGTHTLTLWGDSGETLNLGSTTLNDGIAGQGIDHVRATAGVNGQWQTMTIFGDVGETIILGSFTVYHGPLVEVLTQASYDALGTPDTNTFYVING